MHTYSSFIFYLLKININLSFYVANLSIFLIEIEEIFKKWENIEIFTLFPKKNSCIFVKYVNL